MKKLATFLSCLCLCLPPAYADDEENFDVQEEGMMFDYPRTGLLYKRAMHAAEDTFQTESDNITYVPYFPTSYAGTNDISPGGIYITHWEQDPPSFVTLYIANDSVKLTSSLEIDVQISIGQYDRARNTVAANRKLVTGIRLESGINRIPINIHNYKGDIVTAKLMGSRPKFPILPIEGLGE